MLLDEDLKIGYNFMCGKTLNIDCLGCTTGRANLIFLCLSNKKTPNTSLTRKPRGFKSPVKKSTY